VCRNRLFITIFPIKRRIENNKPVIVPIRDLDELDELVRRHWLTDEAVRLYALVIGEGWRFPQAKRLFWEQFDRLWRKALGYASDHSPVLEQGAIDLRLDHQLLSRLKLL
jgi:hypothetical protein